MSFSTMSVLTLIDRCGALLGQQVPLIKRLDDPTRAKVLAALAGLIILGFAVVLLTWLGARVTQRYRRGTSYFQPTVRPSEHEWARTRSGDSGHETGDRGQGTGNSPGTSDQ
jgi:hypothetical protein